MKRILLIEDEASLRYTLKLNLELEGYEPIALTHGRDILQVMEEQHFDLVLLDVMLPDVDGFTICEQIRLVNTQIPIIFLTAKDTTSDRIQGLKRGADDYLTKPFSLEELFLRMQNLLRLTQRESILISEITKFGDFEINFGTNQANTLQGTIDLTKKEAMFLKFLMERKGEVLSRQQILQSVWGYDIYPSTRTIDNFILNFRRYFETDPRNPQYFHSVRGVGYKFTD